MLKETASITLVRLVFEVSDDYTENRFRKVMGIASANGIRFDFAGLNSSLYISEAILQSTSCKKALDVIVHEIFGPHAVAFLRAFPNR